MQIYDINTDVVVRLPKSKVGKDDIVLDIFKLGDYVAVLRKITSLKPNDVVLIIHTQEHTYSWEEFGETVDVTEKPAQNFISIVGVDVVGGTGFVDRVDCKKTVSPDTKILCYIDDIKKMVKASELYQMLWTRKSRSKAPIYICTYARDIHNMVDKLGVRKVEIDVLSCSKRIVPGVVKVPFNSNKVLFTGQDNKFIF